MSNTSKELKNKEKMQIKSTSFNPWLGPRRASIPATFFHRTSTYCDWRPQNEQFCLSALELLMPWRFPRFP